MERRRQLIAVLGRALRARPEALAAWLGGSDATGRVDELSDLDLVVLADEADAETILEVVERAIIENVGPLDARHRMPPSPLGLTQVFLHVAGWGHDGLVDACVVNRGDEARWLVRERHGTPIVLFDHGDHVRVGSLDREEHEGRVAERVESLRTSFPVFASFPLKEARRDRTFDAVLCWNRFVVAPVAELLRCVHCPDRFDFGLRYLDDDLPATPLARLKRLAFPSDLAAMEALHGEAVALFEETLAEWDRRHAGG